MSDALLSETELLVPMFRRSMLPSGSIINENLVPLTSCMKRGNYWAPLASGAWSMGSLLTFAPSNSMFDPSELTFGPHNESAEFRFEICAEV